MHHPPVASQLSSVRALPPTRLLLAVLLLVFAGHLSAAFHLVEESTASDSATIRVVYTSRAPLPESAVTIPRADDLAIHHVEADPLRDAGRESCLIAVPSVQPGAAEWQVEIVALEGGTLDIVLSDAIIGKTPCIRLDATPSTEFVEAEILLTGPWKTNAGAKRTAMPDVAPFLLNPRNAVSLSGTALQRGPSSLPTPPAPRFVVYTGGAGVLALDATAIVDTSRVRLSHHGAGLPRGGVHNGKLWFYAPWRETDTSEHDVVFSDPDSSVPSADMAQRAPFSTLAPAGSEVSISLTRRFETNSLYERSAPLPVRQRFVKYRAFGPSTVNTTLAIHDAVTTDNLVLSIRLLGLNTIGNSPEHFATMSVVGEDESETASWGGRQAVDVQLHLNPEPTSGSDGKQIGPVPGPVTMTLKHTIPASTISSFIDVQNLDYVDAFYEAYPRLYNGISTFTVPAATDGQPRRITVGGFPPATIPAGVLLLDVTDPTAPVRIIDPPVFTTLDGTVAIEFEAPATARRFHAQTFSSLPSASSMASSPELPAVPPFLRGIYVREASLAVSLAPLMTLRGGGYIELDPWAAYIAYNGGQESPEAIQQALSEIVAAAPDGLAFPYITLVGHGTFDPRNHLGAKSGAQIPTFVDESIDTGFTIENCVDFPYGLLAGGDHLQDAHVARLPVRNSAELDIIVARILAHEALTPTLHETRRPAIFLNDDDPDVIADETFWPAFWSPTGRDSQTITLAASSDGSPERAALITAMQANPHGAAFVLYNGHGNTTFWADERILQATDVPGIDTQNRWPIVLTFTCLNGNYAVPGAASRTLGETWLLTANRGAAAVLVPSSIDYYSFQRAFAVEAFQQVGLPQGQRPLTIGEMITRARISFELAYPGRQVTNRFYLLFGDPHTSLTLETPPTAVDDYWRLFN